MTRFDATLSYLFTPLKTEAPHSPKRNAAFVFDIDSTLFCVSTRTQAILKDLAQSTDFKKNFPELAQSMVQMTVLPTDWGVKQALSRLEVSIPAPAAQLIRRFWKEHFFSNQYLNHDLIYDHADHFVRHCSASGEIFYLTGRSRPLMEEGTLKQLSDRGFPLKSHQRLIMKERDDEHDEDFKLNKLKNFCGNFDEIYFFENEPIIIESVEAGLPMVKIVFMSSTHSARRPSPTHLPTITPEFYRHFWERQ